MATPNKKACKTDIRRYCISIPGKNSGTETKQDVKDSEYINRSDERDSGHAYDSNHDVEGRKRREERECSGADDGNHDVDDGNRSDEREGSDAGDGNHDVEDGIRRDEGECSDANDSNHDVEDGIIRDELERSDADDGNHDHDGSGDVENSDDNAEGNGPGDIIGEILNFVSIYKIMNCRFTGLESVRDMQSLKKAIIETLTKSHNLSYKDHSCHEFGEFNVEWFCHSTKNTFNSNSVKISKELTGSEQSKIPGDRKSGNVQAFYRLKNRQPEIFLLCDGSTYQFILHLADPEFRTNCAKHYIDENNVLKIERYSLAGADLSTNTLFKAKQSIHNIQLEQYIAGITSDIRKDTQLWQLLVKVSGKQSSIGIGFGLNNVCIRMRMGLTTSAAVLKTISSELENIPKTEGPLVQAFEYVKRVKDTSKMADLSKLMCKKFLETIKNGIIDDLYLSHRFFHDFQNSSSFTLKHGLKTLKEWRSVPTMHDVITKLKRHFSESLCLEPIVGSDSRLGHLLENNAIKLSFTTPDKIKAEPIQNFIHGCVVDGDTMYYRLSNKWFKFHSSFFFNIDRNFSILVENCHFQDDEKDILSKILKFPWQYKSDIDVEKHCKILNMNNEELKRLLEMLCKKINIVINDEVCLTEKSYVIPGIAKLCKDYKKKKEQEKKKEKKKKSLDPSLKTSTTEKPDGVKKKKSQRKEESARKILWACRSGVSATPTMQQLLKKPVQVCDRTNDTFTVLNPVLHEELLSEVVSNFPNLDLKENDILCFLKCMMPLKEGDFNELFLFCEQPGYVVFPGDRILSNNVELFDIVIHEEKTKKTFLIHTKDELNHTTRESCAQIRNSAELMWHDLERGHNEHLSLWWEHATKTKSKDVYRQLLKKKLEGIGKKDFLKMFSNEITVVFVLAFRSSNMKPCLSFEFRPIKANDFAGLKPNDNKVFDILVENEYVTETGFLTDRLQILTQAKFITECKQRTILTEYSEDEKKDIYNKLKEIGMCNLSTIAKLELLTLDSTFNRFQKGSRKYFELRLLELESS
ncbi:uncharacterized protein LOC127838745 isoform X2 [Dreissena polymorpha]|uniref:uncharacterized protein LOC127838745 isoform X2 n=1 Tax=Dreissena polymorpha TaxID=45954 RepID=UPI0022650269|nr:uncharacterized protein LOC127838745 isoform X2 [Dreissena polymorpha]